MTQHTKAYLYHVTYHNRLAAIAEDGLRAHRTRSLGAGGYDSHAARGCFLSELDGVYRWHSLAEQFAEHDSDGVLEDGLVPVVLRIDVTWLSKDLVPDEVANHEETFDNYIVPPVVDGTGRKDLCVEPDDIEVWTGDEWIEIGAWESVDPARGVEWEEDDDFEEGGYWQFPYTSDLIPPEARP